MRRSSPRAPPDGPVRVSRAAAGGRLGAARVKLDTARCHGLPLRYAKGWPDRLLGVRTQPVDGVDLAAFLRDLARVLSAADARIGP